MPPPASPSVIQATTAVLQMAVLVSVVAAAVVGLIKVIFLAVRRLNRR